MKIFVLTSSKIQLFITHHFDVRSENILKYNLKQRNILITDSMSYKCQFECALRLDSLANIKIRDSIILQIRATLYKKSTQSPKQNILAIPFSIIDQGHKNNLNQIKNNNVSTINQEGTSFITKKFLMRYADQKVALEEMYIFRIQLTEHNLENILKYQFGIYIQLMSYYQKQAQIIQQWEGSTSSTLSSSAMTLFLSAYRFTCSMDLSFHSTLIKIQYDNSSNLTFQKHLSMATGKFKKLEQIQQVYNSIIQPLRTTYLWLQQQMAIFEKSMNQSTQNAVFLKKLRQKLKTPLDQYHYLLKKFHKHLQSKKEHQDQFLRQQLCNSEGQQLQKTISQDTHYLRQLIFDLWTCFIHYKGPQNIKYYNELKKRTMKSHTDSYQKKNIIITSVNEQNKKLSSRYSMEQDHLNLEFNFLDSRKVCLKMSQDVYRTIYNTGRQKRLDVSRIFIFVHGYQASNYDMEFMSNYLLFKDPNAIVMLSSANQGRTGQPIQESGHRLALQIKNFINNYRFKNIQINIIAHSLGGIIVRASLKYLQLYREKLNSFITFCSPHLGYLYHSSTLVKTSLWLMNQFKKDQSMIELTMQDNSSLNKTYMYELSMRQELKWFKTVILFGSKQDQYVPFWSAMAQDQDFFFQTQSSRTYKTLYNNILEHTQQKLLRIQIVYNDKIEDFSTLIGRTAHIKLLNNIPTLDLIFVVLQNIL